MPELEPANEPARYRALWAAVVIRAVTDAMGFVSVGNYRPDKYRERGILLKRVLVDRAKSWIFDDNLDFPEVCFFAGVDYKTVRRVTALLLEKQKNGEDMRSILGFAKKFSNEIEK